MPTKTRTRGPRTELGVRWLVVRTRAGITHQWADVSDEVTARLIVDEPNQATRFLMADGWEFSYYRSAS